MKFTFLSAKRNEQEAFLTGLIMEDRNVGNLWEKCDKRHNRWSREMREGETKSTFTPQNEDVPLCEPVHLIPMQSNKPASVKDEGYLTEDTSRPCSSGTVAQQQAKNIFRLPAPLNSARAKCQRRSRSACDEHSSSIGMEHGARNKMLSNHSRIHSVERKRKICLEGQSVSPLVVFMRWPKPTEMVMSKYGSPVIAHTLPDRFANVNILLRDGAMSLRPKKLDEVQAGILERCGPPKLA
uniref:Borealin C-terminal domain-containing protein n=1 Tax=Glossina pallidipes TaxID=7398 RepID=A0A1A9Z642_GLOPL